MAGVGAARRNQMLLGHSSHEGINPTMTTTLLVAALLDQHVVVAHVGDSRCYRMRHALLKQLTIDHRASPHGLSRLSSDELRAVTPLVCLPARAVGDADLPVVDIAVEEVEAGDTLLVCSNGVSDVLSEGDMAKALMESRSSQEACRRLLEVAVQAGTDDDATALIVRLRPPPRSSSRPTGVS